MPKLGLGLGLPDVGISVPFGLPTSISITGAVGVADFANKTYIKTNQAGNFLAAATNGSYNYYSVGVNLYITSPGNTNSAADYNVAKWVIALFAAPAYYLMANPSTDKFNFPTTGWTYADPFGGPNTNGESGPANITITAV